MREQAQPPNGEPSRQTEIQGDAAATAYTVLAGFFVGLLVIANVIAVKPVAVGGFSVVPAAVIVYALTFLVTDTVAEVWGKQRTRVLVLTGFVVSLAVAAFVRLAIALPAAPFWGDQAAFEAVLGANLRIVTASMLAYLVSQLHDVWAFHFWRVKTQGRHLWLRNNLSTGVSQLLDSVLFIGIAFYGIWPHGEILAAIVTQYVIKLAIAALDTPLIYVTVGLARRWVTRASAGARA